MKITIKREIVKVETREVDIDLKRVGSGEALLLVDGWSVFRINLNGTGKLYKFIPSYNDVLQVDEDGKIVLEN